MDNIAIKAENISKLYRIGEIGSGTISHDLNRWWHRMRGKEDPYTKIGEENKRDAKGGDWVWALKDVDFEVQAGQVLGVIGKNGAGKSTLLKLLSRVTAPTTGSIKAKGRIASLLEVGTGFHPDLTGKENIFLNGAILGMTNNEIKRKFDEIVSFAGVERYIGTPVKRYSSGMYVRLAFAVAAYLESEILIVDEVLSVGDAEFQKKCLGKMKDVSNQQGKTVLFVSHNMGAVKNLCSHAVLMKNGTLVMNGNTQDVIEEYLSEANETGRSVVYDIDKRPSAKELDVLSIKVLDKQSRIDNLLTAGDDLTVEITYILKEEVKDLRVAIDLMTPDGTEVLSSSDFNFQNSDRLRQPGTYKSVCTIPGRLLNAGNYILVIDFDMPLLKAIVMGLNVTFTISELVYNQLGITVASKPAGIVHPYLEWEIQQL